MSYTKKNLKQDVEDSAQRFQMAPNLEARFATGDLSLQHAGFGYEKLAPNFRVPFGHHHGEQEELYVVVSGSGRVKIDDDIVDFTQWDAIRVEPQAMRCFEAGPDGAELVIFGAPRAGESAAQDAEMKPGWWPEDAA